MLNEEMAPPYAVLGDGSRVPIMNCPECKALGRADMAHYHVCERVVTDAEQRLLDAMGQIPSYKLRGIIREETSSLSYACEAELARRGLK